MLLNFGKISCILLKLMEDPDKCHNFLIALGIKTLITNCYVDETNYICRIIYSITMRNLFGAFLLLGFATSAIAQETDGNKVQAGITYQTGMNFNKPGTKIIGRDGVGAVNSIGLVLNFPFNANIGLSTGLEFDFESFKYDVISTSSVYYRYTDTEIFRKEETPSNSTLYRLTDRKQKAIYGSIPTMLLFRTNAIGDFRYYGKFGARTSFLLGNTINDKGFNVGGDTLGGAEVSQTNNTMKAKSDMFFLRSTIGIAGGAEWNFTGSTSLYAEIGFYYGFTPVHYGEAVTGDDKERDMTLFTYNGSTADYTTLSAKQKQILLKVGILF
jgi:hypothetical protein